MSFSEAFESFKMEGFLASKSSTVLNPIFKSHGAHKQSSVAFSITDPRQRTTYALSSALPRFQRSEFCCRSLLVRDRSILILSRGFKPLPLRSAATFTFLYAITALPALIVDARSIDRRCPSYAPENRLYLSPCLESTAMFTKLQVFDRGGAWRDITSFGSPRENYAIA